MVWPKQICKFGIELFQILYIINYFLNSSLICNKTLAKILNYNTFHSILIKASMICLKEITWKLFKAIDKSYIHELNSSNKYGRLLNYT